MQIFLFYILNYLIEAKAGWIKTQMWHPSRHFYTPVAFAPETGIFLSRELACDKSDLSGWCLNNLFSSTLCNFPVLCCFDP